VSRPAPISGPVLDVEDLRVRYRDGNAMVEAVAGVDLTVGPGEVVGLVGASGSGKSSLLLSLVRLLPASAEVSARKMIVAGTPVLEAKPRRLRQLRGAGAAMIFQDPRASLNPVLRIGAQVGEAIHRHHFGNRRRVRELVRESLERVGLEDPEAVARAFPHALSGGMCQRVMIAMCLTCRPRLLLADEPTTALDVCAQAGILDLLRSLVDNHSGPGQPTSVLLVSHDLRVLADVADRLVVLREGKVVEDGPVATVLEAPAHAHTRRLVSVMPRLGAGKGPVPIPADPSDASPAVPDSVAVGPGREERWLT